MRVPYFCLECEKTHQNNPNNADEDQCPHCGSTAIVEDDTETTEEIDEMPNWDDGHFEGDMPSYSGSREIEE